MSDGDVKPAEIKSAQIKLPIIRPISWPVLGLLLLLLAACAGIGYLIAPFRDPVSNLAAGAYAYLLPALITRSIMFARLGMRRPIKAIRRGDYDQAIAAAQRVEAYFSRHPGIDRWRSVLFFEPSKITYREAAISQTAAALMFAGRKEEYLAALRHYLSAFPRGALVDAYRAALRMMENP